MKVVINICYGGFGLSEAAYKMLGPEWDKYGFVYNRDNRTDPKLVACVEELGDQASGRFAKLTVVEIPDNIEWEIEEYDGQEWISEKHRRWF